MLGPVLRLRQRHEGADRLMMPPPPPRLARPSPARLSPVSVSGLNRLDKTQYREQWISAMHRTAEASAAASAAASAVASAGRSVSQPMAGQDNDYSQFVDIEAEGEIISALAQKKQAVAQEALASAQEAHAFKQLQEIRFYTLCLESKAFADLDEWVLGYDSRAQPSESQQFIIAPPEYLEQLDSIIKLIGNGLEELADMCCVGQTYMQDIEGLYALRKDVVDQAKFINSSMGQHLVDQSTSMPSLSMPSESAQPLSPR